VAKVEPMSATEDAFWRSLMQIVLSLPRRLDLDLIRSAGLSANEYTVLMCLSEAPKQELRMTQLAGAAALSGSRMTRLVNDLQARGLVSKRASSEDGRGNVAKLTPAGMAKVKAAWPTHIASVRQRVLDHVDPSALATATAVLSAVAANLDDT
jgi:DNA-binding MarR family transcriptional regulator